MTPRPDEMALQPAPEPPALDPARFRWVKTRYRRHQGNRERVRRLRQVAQRKIAATPEVTNVADALFTPQVATTQAFLDID